MLFFPHNYMLFPCEWLGERSFMSFSFPIAVLGGVFRLVLGFCIFNGCARDPLCMNFKILPFDHRMINYFIYHACLFSEKSVKLICAVTKVLFYCVYASFFCMNFTFDQLMILYLTFLAMCIHWKFWYILRCIFSKKYV